MHSLDRKGIGIIIVIYNKLCSVSETLASLTDTSAYFVLVLDNSTSKEIRRLNHVYCTEHNYIYHDFGENVGLSKAYNFGLSVLEKKTDTVIVMDDDTVVPADYFHLAEQTLLDDTTSAVLVPMVYTGNMLLSPCRRTGALFTRFKSFDSNSILPVNVSAINSGMIIRLDKFSQLSRQATLYDENLFLDCVDHDFMLNQIIGKGISARTFPAVLQQSFFDNQQLSSSDVMASARRFRVYVRDYLYYCRKNKLGKLIPYLYILFRALKLSVSSRSIVFFSCLRTSENKQTNN